MKKLMSFSLLGAASLFLVACSSSDSDGSSGPVAQIDPSQESVSFRVTFTSNWSSAKFPTNYPSSAHFSPPVVVTHNNQAQIWGPNATVTDGVQQVAETGGTSKIKTEIQAKSENGVIGSSNIGSGPGNGSVSVELDASLDYPLLSVITMVAPSPDWVVGVHDLSLRENGEWIESKTIELQVYDVGTDSGTRFTSGNQSESRRTAILLSSDRGDTDFEDGINFSTGDHIAELKIERIQDQ